MTIIPKLFILLILTTGCGKLRNFRTLDLILPKQEAMQVSPAIELITKNYSEGTFEKSSYSFFNLSQNVNINKNNIDIEFSDFDGKNPIINTQIFKDQIGHIVDLGEVSCKLFPNTNEQISAYPGIGHSGLPYPEDRVLDTLFWLHYSDMYGKLRDQVNGSNAIVATNHCYILERTNSHYQIIVAFHIKEYLPARSIKIDEIEVFSKQVFSK